MGEATTVLVAGGVVAAASVDAGAALVVLRADEASPLLRYRCARAADAPHRVLAVAAPGEQLDRANASLAACGESLAASAATPSCPPSFVDLAITPEFGGLLAERLTAELSTIQHEDDHHILVRRRVPQRGGGSGKPGPAGPQS